MGRMRVLLIVVGILSLAVVHCGGEGDGGTTTPSATSAKAANAVGAFGQLSQSMVNIITATAPPPPAGQSAKVVTTSSDGLVTCDWNQLAVWEFDCAVRDGVESTGTGASCQSGEEGCCDVSGEWQYPDFEFVLSYDCHNYHPANQISVDGNYTLTMSFSQTTAQTSASAAKAVSKQASAGCTISDDIDCSSPQSFSQGGITCEFNCDSTPVCSQAFAMFLITIEVGDRGLTMTDECGTYTWTEGTQMSGAWCIDYATNTISVTFNVNGTFNNQSVNQNYNLDCDFSGAM